jgi:hypothetical protein
MDPFLEVSGDWRDFHLRFLNACADALAECLPTNYAARIEERFEDVKERWIEIRRAPDWRPVTIIELLSPSNKYGHGHDDYLYKRVSLIARTIHLVEIDLLIGGHRLPMGRPLERHYHALVSRTEERPLSNVYSWSIRDPLPTVPVPLLAPDPDMPLELAALFASVYRKGQYERSINYSVPIDVPLSAVDRVWVNQQVGFRDHG